MLAAFLVLAGVACFGLHTWAEINCTRLDVETGRRDPGALVDDYGSNRGWYWRYKLPSLAGFIGGLVLWCWAIIAASVAVQARDLDGRYAASPLKPWFDSLKSGKGPCCSDADGWALSDVDWETNGARYRVRVPSKSWTPSKAQPTPPTAIEMIWVDVETDAVINEPNRAGRTMVWPLWGIGGVTIRCFMPGSMT